ncbi:MAG: SRPBCC family protein [Saprospiraceae bacterium]|nr:SRPBCC family protein [Saprospiraceae bacterium]
MNQKFQSKQEIIINAPIETVWEYNMDLSKIPDFHPTVSKVDLISNTQFRETGVSYQCNIVNSQHKCVEKDIEIIPHSKIVTVFPSDTMGLSKLLPDYIVETNFIKVDDRSTRVEILHYYSSSKLKVMILNFFIKRKMAKQTLEMLIGMKKKIEEEMSLN